MGTETSSQSKMAAAACHLGAWLFWVLPVAGHLLGPIALWLILRRDDPFIDDHGKEAVNFQISCTLYAVLLLVVLAALTFPVGVSLISGVLWDPAWPARLLTALGLGVLWLLLIAIVVAWHLLIIVAAWRAGNGQPWRYPLTIRWIR